MEIIDLPGLLASHPPATFHSFHEFNGHSFGAVDITGTSPVWEQHPDTDESRHSDAPDPRQQN